MKKSSFTIIGRKIPGIDGFVKVKRTSEQQTALHIQRERGNKTPLKNKPEVISGEENFIEGFPRMVGINVQF